MSTFHHHNRVKGVVSHSDDGGRQKKVLRCHQCGTYLGETNQCGELAGIFYCKSCKARTEVIRSAK